MDSARQAGLGALPHPCQAQEWERAAVLAMSLEGQCTGVGHGSRCTFPLYSHVTCEHTVGDVSLSQSSNSSTKSLLSCPFNCVNS